MVRKIAALLAAVWLLAASSIVAAPPVRAQSRVVIVQGVDTQSLDPAFRADAVSASLQRHVFDTVMFRDADMRIVPGLAEAVERIAPTRWRIRLRRGISFTNGEPMNAAALKFTIDRLLDPALRATARPFFANFTAVDAVDDATVEVT